MWRRWALGLATLCGRRRGYFIPYRYAGDSPSPAVYTSLEPLFRAAESEFEARLREARTYRDTLGGFIGSRPPAPRFEQDWFPRLDAAIAYSLVRTRRPGRIVEIGSGHSTRFLARAIADGGLKTTLTAIDPAPRAALAGVSVEWLRQPVQAAGHAPFATLRPGDMLLIDSSHVLMPGSDVDFLFNQVWPRLPSGVLVHVHDIFLPDAYPESWAWRGYNEQNALASRLGRDRLLWSSHWAATRMAAAVTQAGLDVLPLMPGAFETSLWLETAQSAGNA